ncbi:hypothetical protein ACFVS2_21200 [Brevibacillus sp. NPDC058079]|uniref:hypothetical protein n=1 Tax=Brevibacillus sp. NPDC058079 TaxID=3346330 RepID=UPI0036E6AE28
MGQMLKELGVGDYVYFQYGKNQEYPGTIKSISNGVYKVEICTNKKKSEGNEVDIVEGTRDQLRPM